MAVYLKKFETHIQYENYINGSGAILPNVSLCTTEGDVHYNPSSPVPPTPTETRVVAKYNVTDTTNPTMIASGTSNFSAIEIDGIEQSEVVNEYTFDTVGEHTVKYTLTDPTSIGVSAFTYCYSLTSIDIPDSVTSIGDWAFYYCYSLTSCTIGSGVTSIGESAFDNCSSLTSIDIPNSVTSIGYAAFSNCSSLTSCTIGSGVTIIGESAFGACYALPSITIPSGITSIGRMAFDECADLISVTILASVPPTIDEMVFNYNAEGRKIYVPSGSVNAYKTASEHWEELAEDIEPIQ